MTYSEEEITQYLKFSKTSTTEKMFTLQFLKTCSQKFSKNFHVKIAAIHIFSKIMVSVTVTNVFILLAEFLSKILIPKIVIIFKRKVFTRGHIIIKIK